ncbi:MAG: hypothetical protein P1V20_07130 [Verrucomicrobiales bacterium]|nr:hypothetical protein [Verrucomicrobiales bacterium]
MSSNRFQKSVGLVASVGLTLTIISCENTRNFSDVGSGKEPVLEKAAPAPPAQRRTEPHVSNPVEKTVAGQVEKAEPKTVEPPKKTQPVTAPASVATALPPVKKVEVPEDLPRAVDSNTKIVKFAGSDMIKHPIGMTFTKGGKLLVIESHTHFRPKTYNGPESDQIIWIRDTDNDGKADKRSVFFGSNLKATMNIAVHPQSGAIYAATKTGIVRIWDRDDDGVADPGSEEKVIFFEFDSKYLDNGYGCAGLAFDNDGNLLFGIGGLLGAPYTLQDGDGTSYSNQGEGGNIWKCTADGHGLKNFATGFWNPFGLCYTPEGHAFVTDNDPSSRPPSRLHHVIDGGDYGYQFRYGSSGKHPFISWDGELPGTLPMLSGTGDAPCDVIYHQGNLIVGSWSDHRVEVYPLKWDKTHFTTSGKTMVKGGVDFRPVGFAVNDAGELYMSDWVKGDYQLHGHGAIWKLENWQPAESPVDPVINPADDIDAENPWTFSRMISGEVPEAPMSAERKQVYDLLSARFHKKEEGLQLLRDALNSEGSSETLRMLALKWISDEKLPGFDSEIEKEIRNPSSAEIFEAAITVKARLGGQGTMDKDLQKLVLEELDSDSPLARRAAFLILDERGKVELPKLREIYKNGDDYMRSGVALTLQEHEDKEGARAFAKEIIENDPSEKVRSFASLTNPDVAVVEPNDPLEHGEYLFHKNCAKCHCVGGFGKKGGLDLTSIGVRGKEHIIRSVHEPSLEIAPQYETWKVRMADGKEHVGFVLGEKAGMHYYSDAAGDRFTINTTNMVEREHLPYSLMPPMLNKQIGEDKFDHLVTWLTQLK